MGTIVMPNDVEVLLQNIATGFRVSLPVAIATTLIVVAFASGLIAYHLRQRRAERETRTRLYEARYDSLLRSLDLPAGSAALLDRLATRLHDSSKRYLLLENEATFNSCLRRLPGRESISPALVAALRMKLGFRTLNPERAPLSSGDIAEETVVLLERPAANGKKRERFPAKIVSVEPAALALAVQARDAFDRGDRLKLYFYNFAGLYMFPTRVISVKAGLVLVGHSNAISAVQRRRYYRRKLSAPAYIRTKTGEGSEELFVKTLLQDLGGGGAKVVNPHDIFQVHDRVELALDLGLHKWVKVPADVVRIGRDGSASLKFHGLKESSRDLILRALFRRYNAYLRERGREEESATP